MIKRVSSDTERQTIQNKYVHWDLAKESWQRRNSFFVISKAQIRMDLDSIDEHPLSVAAKTFCSQTHVTSNIKSSNTLIPAKKNRRYKRYIHPKTFTNMKFIDAVTISEMVDEDKNKIIESEKKFNI